jgi:hypothetical protein
MATRFDFRTILRGIGARAQDENQDRLLSGTTVNGAPVEPRVDSGGKPTKGKKRVRVLGVRVNLGQLTKNVGVRTGAMLKDMTKRSNIRVTRTTMKIIPSNAVFKRWMVFNKGDKRQAARPISGMSPALVADASKQIAQAMREQVVRGMNAGLGQR